MSELFQLVCDHLEAVDKVTQEWQTTEGTKTVELSLLRPVAWIERVHERGVLTALDCLSIIFFVLDDWSALPTREQEIQLVEGWAGELRRAATAGEVQARHPFTLLPLPSVPDGWDWGLLESDADNFAAARAMAWKFGDIATHIYRSVLPGIESKRFPSFLGDAEPQPQAAAPEPKPAPEWKELARCRAHEIIKEHTALDLFLSVERVADIIASEFRSAGIMGTSGKPLSGATIKRHALRGISSAQGKQLSTSPRRGK